MVTVKPVASETVSLPVTTWMLRALDGVFPAIVTGTIMLVRVAAVGAPAVTPVPLKVTTELLLKWVMAPAIVTGRSVWPACRLDGVCDRMGVPLAYIAPVDVLPEMETW